MAVTVRDAARWSELVAGLAAELTTAPPAPFEMVQVLVSSRGTGRMLSQALATSLPAGICAGISFITVPQWIRNLARANGLAEDLEAWSTERAAVVASEVLGALATEHPVLEAHLSAGGSGGRRQQLALRSIQLLRRYVEHAPNMVERWLEGDDVDALGHPLAEHLVWQPDVLRRTTEALEADPLELWHALTGAAASESTTLHTFALSEVSAAQQRVLDAAGTSADVTHWRIEIPAGAPAPRVSLHASHGRSRQVEVLRDELTRRFQEDPELEPRDVVVVCQNPQEWWPHLQLAFSPVDDPTAHPGRGLRVRTRAAFEPNLVLEVVSRCLRLGDSRATATEVVELLLLPPIAHRWRLQHRREELLALVAESGVRWGLDQEHRAHLGLAGISQNTWLRGMDRLLLGVASSPGTDTGLGITGAGTVGTSDMELIGTLSELVSRLRRFNAIAAGPATVVAWTERVRGLLQDLVGCSFDDEWMLQQTTSALTDLSDQLRDQAAELNRTEFTRLFEFATREFTPRPAVGNGALHVIGVGELQHVDFKLVCLLGITDARSSSDVDSVDLGESVPDGRRRQLQRLLAHARAADEVLVVHQGRDPLTDQPVAQPTTLSWLLRELSVTDEEPRQHPLLAHSEDNFTNGDSFDSQALATALALRTADPAAPAGHALRRRAALALPVQPARREVRCQDLVVFLKDPAQDFLRAVAEVKAWNLPELADEMPFTLGGLDSWQVRDRFLDAFRRGLSSESAELAEVSRELAPPGRIGQATVAKPRKEVEALWQEAATDWAAQTVDHRIDVDLGDIRLADTIRTRGGSVVHVDAGDGIRTRVSPWVQQLALSAAGIAAQARIHHFENDYGDFRARTVTLPAPDREVALTTLRAMAAAWAQGRSRLIPLPQDLAMAFVGGLRAGTLKLSAWQVPESDWRSTLWRRYSDSWRLFYSGIPDEVFEDPATHLDPEPPPGGRGSAFAAWAVAIYGPLLAVTR